MDPNSSSRRVVITGMGLVSPIGNSKERLWESLCAGLSGVAPIAELPAGDNGPAFGGQATEFTGCIDDFGALAKDQKKMIRKGLKLMCRETMMGVAVAQAALQDAGLGPDSIQPERSGCLFGTDYMLTMPEDFVAGITICQNGDGQFEYGKWGGEGMPRVTPLWLLKYLPNMPASHVAIYNDLRGPNNSITHREAAANLAIGEAYATIRRGSADMIVAGATGTRVRPMNAIHAVQQEETLIVGVDPARASRPFDRDRSGMVLGEGAGAVILEDIDVAQARGATIYGEVLGRGSSSVAFRNAVADRRTAVRNTIVAALRDAHRNPADIGHIHAHGISTRLGDAEEAQAIAEALGETRTSCPVTAAKSYFGNLGAGSGVVELIASLLALRNGTLFSIMNYETPDPECPIHAAKSSAAAGSSFLNINVTPQGQASAVMVQAFNGSESRD